MATLTIRDLDDSLKLKLRIRAANRNHSMEEEARLILRAALTEPPSDSIDLAARIRSRFSGLGDVELPIATREPVRPLPLLERRPAERRGPATPARRRSSPRRSG
jgi:plasmid stability protein